MYQTREIIYTVLSRDVLGGGIDKLYIPPMAWHSNFVSEMSGFELCDIVSGMLVPNKERTASGRLEVISKAPRIFCPKNNIMPSWQKREKVWVNHLFVKKNSDVLDYRLWNGETVQPEKQDDYALGFAPACVYLGGDEQQVANMIKQGKLVPFARAEDNRKGYLTCPERWGFLLSELNGIREKIIKKGKK